VEVTYRRAEKIFRQNGFDPLMGARPMAWIDSGLMIRRALADEPLFASWRTAVKLPLILMLIMRRDRRRKETPYKNPS
jgi:hypothetical protein